MDGKLRWKSHWTCGGLCPKNAQEVHSARIRTASVFVSVHRGTTFSRSFARITDIHDDHPLCNKLQALSDLRPYNDPEIEFQNYVQIAHEDTMDVESPSVFCGCCAGCRASIAF